MSDFVIEFEDIELGHYKSKNFSEHHHNSKLNLILRKFGVDYINLLLGSVQFMVPSIKRFNVTIAGHDDYDLLIPLLTC